MKHVSAAILVPLLASSALAQPMLPAVLAGGRRSFLIGGLLTLVLLPRRPTGAAAADRDRPASPPAAPPASANWILSAGDLSE